MMAFLKKHKIATAAFLLFFLSLLYFSFVAIKAYLDTPAIISQINQSGRLTLRLEDFSEAYLNALIAVEDPNFYSHDGVDLTTPGAGWTTITQGLVKIYFFKDGFTPGFLRINKLRQTVMAWSFNRRADKQTQLRIFINSVYLGSHQGKEVRGFQEGAHSYFDKEFSALARNEFLSLVAMIAAPNEFNVAAQPPKNRERVSRIERLLNGECKPADLGDVYYKNCG